MSFTYEYIKTEGHGRLRYAHANVGKKRRVEAAAGIAVVAILAGFSMMIDVQAQASSPRQTVAAAVGAPAIVVTQAPRVIPIFNEAAAQSRRGVKG